MAGTAARRRAIRSSATATSAAIRSRCRARASGSRTRRRPSRRRPSRCASSRVSPSSRARRASGGALTAAGSFLSAGRGRDQSDGYRCSGSHCPAAAGRRPGHTLARCNCLRAPRNMLYRACVLSTSPGAPVTTTSTPASADAEQRWEHLRALSDQLPRFVRLVHALKAQQASEGRDRGALGLLFPLVRLGPLRQGALADLVYADPSTVSRHVTSLVERGLVTRVADETDGRASRLVVTDAGHAELEQLRRERQAHVERATGGWSEDELSTFTALFSRLIDDLTAGLPGSPCGPGNDAPAAPTDLPAPREKR